MDRTKKLGLGSFALVLFLVSSVLLFASDKGYTAGEYLLKLIGLNVHELVIVVPLLLVAVFLARKYPTHLFSKSGLISSSILLGLILTLALIDLILRFVGLF
ncbi:hypothetical protein MKX54_19525 [Alkalihalobacillus sp. FSL R5-0424]